MERVKAAFARGISPKAIAAMEGVTLPIVYKDLKDPLPEPALYVWTSMGYTAVPTGVRRLLGTVSDADVAAQVGYTREWVTRVRTALGVPAEWGREKAARQAQERRRAQSCEGAGLVVAESLLPEVRRRFAAGARTAQIAFEIGAPRCRVHEMIKGLSTATTWDSLVAVLAEHGPLTSRELEDLWRPRPQRWIGGYMAWGWLTRDADGRYSVASGKGREQDLSTDSPIAASLRTA